MSPLTAQAVFYYAAAASVASALVAVTRKNPVHSMLWVLALLLHVALIFLLLGAEFLAAVQTIVYAGAILVFYLVVLLLIDVPDEAARPRFSPHWPWAAGLGVALVIVVSWLGLAGPSATGFPAARSEMVVSQSNPSSENLTLVGQALFGPLALPFEIAGLLLLAAIVGAVVLAGRRGAL